MTTRTGAVTTMRTAIPMRPPKQGTRMRDTPMPGIRTQGIPMRGIPMRDIPMGGITTTDPHPMTARLPSPRP